jgi:hypothetical protein
MAISKDKIINYKLCDGSVDAIIYKKFLKEIKLKSNQKYFVDNAR